MRILRTIILIELFSFNPTTCLEKTKCQEKSSLVITSVFHSSTTNSNLGSDCTFIFTLLLTLFIKVSSLIPAPSHGFQISPKSLLLVKYGQFSDAQRTNDLFVNEQSRLSDFEIRFLNSIHVVI